jgi:hypothetical protein
MRVRNFSFFVLFFSFLVVFEAQEEKKGATKQGQQIELTFGDGSAVKGRLLSYQNGVYRLQVSQKIWEVREEEIEAVHFFSQKALSSLSLKSSEASPFEEEIRQLLNKIEYLYQNGQVEEAQDLQYEIEKLKEENGREPLERPLERRLRIHLKKIEQEKRKLYYQIEEHLAMGHQEATIPFLEQLENLEKEEALLQEKLTGEMKSQGHFLGFQERLDKQLWGLRNQYAVLKSKGASLHQLQKIKHKIEKLERLRDKLQEVKISLYPLSESEREARKRELTSLIEQLQREIEALEKQGQREGIEELQEKQLDLYEEFKRLEALSFSKETSKKE